MSKLRLVAQTALVGGLGLAAFVAVVWWSCDNTIVGELALRAAACLAK